MSWLKWAAGILAAGLIALAGSSVSGASAGGGVDDGEDHRVFTSGGVDVKNTTSSSACVSAMDEATRIMQPDLDALTKAMERDKQYCTGEFECTYTANGAAILACAAVNRARMEVPS